MGKTKKAKPLTQEEIWDDSALVQSWDEAVEEYKLYHSIHAKGENAEDVLREAEAVHQEDQDAYDPSEKFDYMDTESQAVDAPVVDSSADAVETEKFNQLQGAAGTDEPSTRKPQVEDQNQVTETGIAAPAGAIPSQVLAQVQDEGLKNLMMSWYYAGYYTGLYEGQQQASQNKKS